MPTDPVSTAVALADKIDTLVGFWAIDEKPTGSKDPYALRRAELGFLRIIIENGLKVSFSRITELAYQSFVASQISALAKEISRIDLEDAANEREALSKIVSLIQRQAPTATLLVESKVGKLRPDLIVQTPDYDLVIELKRHVNKLLDFSAQAQKYWRAYGKELGATADQLILSHVDNDFAVAVAAFVSGRKSFGLDRLKILLKEQGARHDLVDAVLAQGGEGQDDLLLIVRRVEALAKFLDTDDGKNLLAGYKRAANIIAIEEKKDKRQYQGKPDLALLIDPIEKHLWNTIQSTVSDANHHIAHEDFESAMETLSTLRTAVDSFFETVLVNADDPTVRENRLKLLNEIREATRAVADFSKIAG
ncbi:MAG: glycine--tRNA ligase subunit beta [Rhizobiales bacterium]|nr:glycine--tRNA ligase subunit beta [Hyphomicrobiales bacterium]